MSQAKVYKPPRSERNNVTWIEKNLKFLREHGRAYPKPAWVMTHTVGYMICLVIYFILILAIGIIDNAVFQISSVCVTTVLFTFFAADVFRVQKQRNKAYAALRDGGGEIVDPWNASIIKSGRHVACYVIAAFALIYYFIVGIVLFSYFKWQSKIDFSSLIFIYNIVNIGNMVYSNNYGNVPNIFLGLDDGMFFGGAVFSYEVLSGIRYTGKLNRFDLYYEGEKVASGNMLPEDMKYLQEIIALRDKYEAAIHG